jgi:predicted NACHT family NTPase
MLKTNDFEIISIIFNKPYSVSFPKDTVLTLNSDYLILKDTKVNVDLEEFEYIDLNIIQEIKIYRKKKFVESNIMNTFFESINEEKIDGNWSVNISAVVWENWSWKSTLLQLFKQTVWTNQSWEKNPDANRYL